MIYKCPKCRQPVSLSSTNKWRPFCSERCKLIDLGAWIDGTNKIPAREDDEDRIPDSKNGLTH
jgi:hypothetical protein